MKFPRKGAAGLRIAIQQEFMVDQVVRRPRLAVLLKIGWRGASEYGGVEQFSSDEG
jgi:hypothetical protein